MSKGPDTLPETIAGLHTRSAAVGSSRNYHLDAMRGLAALIVVCYHTRLAFFLPYKEAGSGLLVNLLYIDHYFAGAAVSFFFALSGYLVGTSVLRANQRGKWSWFNYLLNRITRLWVVLIPALLLTALWDFIGRSTAHTLPTYLEQSPSYFVPLTTLDTFGSFVGTLFFVQDILTRIYGTLGPAWSLANEFWYYILFPLAAICFFQRSRAILYGVLFLAVAWFSGGHILVLFPTWLAGVAAGYCAKRFPLRSNLTRRGLFVASFALIVASILGQAAHRLGGAFPNYTIGLGSLGLIWSALCAPPASGLYARSAILLSEISYTLYLTHQPLMILLSAFWHHGNRWRPDLPHVALEIIPISIALLFAYLMYFLFESRTDKVRDFLKSVILARTPSPPLPIKSSL